jgi:putative Holliday junction resolvase
MPKVQQEAAPQNVRSLLSEVPRSGPIVALDPGTKRIGVSVCDELQTIARPLEVIRRKSWKSVHRAVLELLERFDARALVIGLPLNTDGSESEMSGVARSFAHRFGMSVDIPVFLQDERVTSYEAKGRLWSGGASVEETQARVDSEAAVIILSDFLDRLTRARRSG